MSDPTGYGRCSLARFEPGSLTVQAAIPIGCDISGPMFVATDDGIWWKDRSGADINGKGGHIRHVDLPTNTVDRSVELPSLNGYLQSAGSTVFYSDDVNGPKTYRLDPGTSAFVSMGQVPSPFLPTRTGVWTQLYQSGQGQPEADFYTGPGKPAQRLPIDGVLVGADEHAVYTSRSAGPDELWRYVQSGDDMGQNEA